MSRPPDEAILLHQGGASRRYPAFRVGDFYETFGEDAIKASGILGITLTRRANGSATYVELAGFPYHAIDTYLPKLVRAANVSPSANSWRIPSRSGDWSSAALLSW